MKIYTVQRMDKFDYDFSVELKNLGIYVDKARAIVRARQEYETMQGEYEDEMESYSDEVEECWATSTEADDENGYYKISFGYEQDYQVHSVAVDKHELSPFEVDSIFRKCERDYLIEDIKGKAEELEIDLNNKDINKIADRAEHGLSNNDSYWESYWLSIEYALEND